jgi:hypothetical protein
MKVYRVIPLVCAAFAACGSSDNSSSTPNNARPSHGAAAQDSAGLGGVAVEQDGQAVWPPSGPGCAQLVTCCEQLAAIDQAMPLACQLAIANYHDCGKAKASVAAMALQLKLSVPDSCR